MMALVLLLLLITVLCLFLLYAFIKRINLRSKKNGLFTGICLVLIVLFYFFTGADKIKSAIATVIRQSAPKQPQEVYRLLFKNPVNNCVKMVHFKDQLVPKLDCCIWLEVTTCPAELNRIIRQKKYIETIFSNTDSVIFLKPFAEKPEWWAPQTLGESIVKLQIKFNSDNEQSLFFGKDSSHVFICDQAL